MKTLHDIILSRKPGDTLCHKVFKNRDGGAFKARVNGKLKTWKSRPGYYELPMKYGLYHCFYITPDNINEWTW